MCMIRYILLGIAVFAIGADISEAGVKGGRFTGTALNSFNQMIPVDESFLRDGTFVHVEGSHAFYGTFAERGNFVVSTWTATISDGSADGIATFSGTSYFGLVTTFFFLNTDNNATAFGLLMRSGSASPN